jgi:biotin carboxylase
VKRVLLLATTTGYQIRSFGEAAEKLRVRLVFASDRCDQLQDPWWDGAIPIRFHEQDASVQAIVDVLSSERPDGVLAVGDRPTVIAAHVAAAFNLPGNSPEAAAASRNKLASRRAFQAAGLLTPSFRAEPLTSDADSLAQTTAYPAVLKPLSLSGSRGVMRVNDEDEFTSALVRLQQLLQSPDVRVERDAAHDEIMIESFVPGKEFAVEGLLTRGVFRALAIFDKPDPLDGPFFEETIYVTPSRQSSSTELAIVDSVAAAASAIGLHHGPVHAECRVNERGVYVLEVAARPIGGLCSKALRFVSPKGTAASLEEVLLRHAVGEDVGGYERERDASGVMMIPIPRRGVYRGVEGLEEAGRVAGIEEIRITAKPDVLIVPLPEGRSYLGFIFARATDPLSVEQALRAAHARLQFVIVKELAVMPSA